MAGDTRFPGWCCRQIAAQLSQALFTMADLHAQVSDLKEENRQLKFRIGKVDIRPLMEDVSPVRTTDQNAPLNMATPRIESEEGETKVKQEAEEDEDVNSASDANLHNSVDRTVNSLPVAQNSNSQAVVFNTPLHHDFGKMQLLHEVLQVGGDFKCDKCSSAFPTSDLLMLHHAVHISRSFHVCKICNAMFLLKADLYRHWASHPNVKQYICDLCGKAYTSKNNYKLHVKTHTGEGLYPCEVCGKPFHSENHLNVHRRIHTGERPYECQYCDKSFTQKSGLINHTRLHTGEKPFLCPSCPKAFTQKSNLNFHLSKHHPPLLG